MHTTRNAYDLERMVTFEQNRKLPVYRWFHYKEGFARDFVNYFLDYFDVEGKVLDPFCGSGTTLLACKERGIDCIGGDAMPIPVFVSRVKTRDYDIDLLESIRKEIISVEREDVERSHDPFVKKFFDRKVLNDIVFYRDVVNQIETQMEREFFMLALMGSAYKDSWIHKDGAVVKVRKRDIAPFRKVFSNETLRMIKDLKKLNAPKCDIDVRLMDARSMDIASESIDAIITSPPYLNKDEYSKIHVIENILFFGGKSSPLPLIGEGEFEDLFPKQDLPGMTKQYLYSMHLALKEMHRVLKKGGKAAVNISGGVFDEGVVESDLFIADLAERIGFEVDEIIIVREKQAMRNRTEKIGKVRESVVVLTKH